MKLNPKLAVTIMFGAIVLLILFYTLSKKHKFEYTAASSDEISRSVYLGSSSDSTIRLVCSRGGDQGYAVKFDMYYKNLDHQLIATEIFVRDNNQRPNKCRIMDTITDPLVINGFLENIWSTKPMTLSWVECTNNKHFPQMNQYSYSAYVKEFLMGNCFVSHSGSCISDLKRYFPIVQIFNDTNYFRYTSEQLSDNKMIDSVIRIYNSENPQNNE